MKIHSSYLLYDNTVSEVLLYITHHTDLRLPETNTKCDPEYLPEFFVSWFLHKQIYKIPKLFLEYHRVHDPVS